MAATHVMLQRLLLALAATTLAPPSAHALRLTPVKDDGFGHAVLLVHDCEAVAEDMDCRPHEGSFQDEADYESPRAGRYHYRGDAAALKSMLESSAYEEVWLLSGGGNLNEGILIARELRAHAMPVRVPNDARLEMAGFHITRPFHCVSACTVAFMGGIHRTIDDGATYEVHAASAVQWGDTTAAARVIQAYTKVIDTEGLESAATIKTSGTRSTARDLFLVFHDALLLTFRPADVRGEREARDRQLNAWVRDGVGRRFSYDRRELDRDTRLYALEKTAVMQDILMRVERRAMDQAIAAIAQMVPGLGRRADAALAMLAAMYDNSSIKETSVMARETLLKMGYVTEFVK